MQVPHSPAPEIQQFQDRIESTGGQSGLCGRCQKATSYWFRIIRTPADSVMQSGKEKMIMKCEKCGYEMENHSTAQTVCMECPHCGWGFAATMPRPLDEDMTDYKIYLNPGNAETMENIKLISAVCHVNYLRGQEIALLAGTCAYLQSRAGSCFPSLQGRKGHADSKKPEGMFLSVQHHSGFSI